MAVWEKVHAIPGKVKINFTDILNSREKLTVFFTDNALTNYEILQYLSSWRELFRSFLFFFPDFDYPFFNRLLSFEQLTVAKWSKHDKPLQKTVILSFRYDSDVLRYLGRCRDSVIIDVANRGNLHFYPEIQQPLQLIEDFAHFAGLPCQISSLSFKFLKTDASEAVYNFFQNKFLNFILDVRELEIFRKIDDLIVSLKQNFPCNIYLTSRILKKNRFISVKNLPTADLMKLYTLAHESDVFFSDNPDTVRFFSNFYIDQFLLGSKPVKGINNIDPANPNQLITNLKSHLKKNK